MKIHKALVFLFAASFLNGNFVQSDEIVFNHTSAQEFIKKGNDAYCAKGKTTSEQLDGAAEAYWQSVIAGGGQTATGELEKVYNGFHFASSYDWGIVRKYIQKAADAEFQRRGRQPERYDNNFFIIAPESRIIERYGVETISKKWFWNGDTRCNTAMESLFKKSYLDGKNGRFTFRTSNFGPDLGDVAILDLDMAKANFQFTLPPTVPGRVYVKSPADPDVLIPFENFHRYVYESKMGAFQQICNKLGAKEVKVYYSKKDKTNKDVLVQVNANAVGTLDGAQGQLRVKTEHSAEEIADLTMTFDGPGIVHTNIKSPWLASEPSWNALVRCRTEATNPTDYKKARFEYVESYNVNVETKAAFEKAGIKVGVGTNVNFANFEKIVWIFEVKFHPARMRNPILIEIK